MLYPFLQFQVLNNVGDMQHPCYNPLIVKNAFDNLFPIFTLYLLSQCSNYMTLMNDSSILVFSMFCTVAFVVQHHKPFEVHG